MTIESVYTIQDIMKLLRVSMATVTTELTSGRLKSFRIGRQYRITESSLQAYMRGEFEPVDFLKEDAEPIQPVIAEVVQEVAEPIAKQIPQKVTAKPAKQSLSSDDEIDTRIMQLREQGTTFTAIAEILNSEGLTTKTGKPFNNDNLKKRVALVQKHNKSLLTAQ